MSVLYAGLEPCHLASSAGVTTTAGHATSFARALMQLSGGAANFTSGPHLLTPLFDEATDIWLHFNYSVNLSASSGRYPIQFLNASDVFVVGTYAPNSNQQWMYRNSGGTLTAFGPEIGIGSTMRVFDVNIKRTVDGHIRVYNNEVLIAEVVGDMSHLTPIRRMGFQSQAGTSSWYTYVSQLLAMSTSTLGARVCSLALGTATAENDWTGSVTDINGIGSSTATAISSDLAGERSIYALGDVPAAGAALFVKSVLLGARAKRNTSGPDGIRFVAKSGATEVTQDMTGLSYSNAPYLMKIDADPATGLQWEHAAVNALVAGFESYDAV